MKAQSIKQILSKGKGRLKKINERWKPSAGTVQMFVESVSVALNDKREVVAKWKVHIQNGDDKGKSFNHSMLLMYPEDHDYDEKELKRKNKKIQTSLKNLAIFGIDEENLDRDLIEEQAGSTIEATFWKPDPEKMDDAGKAFWANAWPTLYMNELIEGPSEEEDEDVEASPEVEEKPKQPKKKTKTAKKKEEPKPEPEPEPEAEEEAEAEEEEEDDDDDEYEYEVE
jgi:hypothetical protein